ncbi:acyl-CoA synthetase (AMP-forming)/AMP-acid ligase II [Paraburkholderia sp. Cpub6]|nr:AMP-binding protein [Paraburkholderia sp. Cpub6]MBB5462292.1 acyl-CoA synthetase (AMP-forming)/AMP-acid ligase II [Paraburkholderia sp. Cpub6]
MSSLELEDLIFVHPAVAEVAVICVKDAKWGERPLPLIVLKAVENTNEQSIQKHWKEYAICGVISKYAVLGADPHACAGQAATAASTSHELDMRTRAELPVPLVELRIVDEQTHDVAHDGKTSGEIVARAPWLIYEYVGDPAASERLWAGGYLHTNDIGGIDSHGYLHEIRP